MIQLLRFAIVGVANTGLGYAVIFACMYLLHWGPLASNIAGYALGLMVSFTLNRRFTFRSRAPARAQLMRFLGIFVVAWGANFAALAGLVHLWGVHEGLAQVLAGVVYFALSFVLSKHYVFRDPVAVQGPPGGG